MRLLEIKRSGKEIHILYFGDFDPSGNDMDSALCYISLGDIDLQRVAVIEERIKQSNLPVVPENQETITEMCGRLYVLELDALLSNCT